MLTLYRTVYTGLPRRMWLLAGVMLINRCGTMVLPYLSLYMTQHLHFSVEEAGAVLAAFGLGSLLGTFLGGQLTDRLGFYAIQLYSLLFGGLMLIGLQFVQSFWGLCAMVFVFTALGDAFRPANSAAIAYYSTPDTRTRAYSLNRLAVNLGWAVGGGLGGLLASVDYRLLFWVDGLTCLAAAFFLLYALPRPVRATPADADTALTDQVATRSPYHDGLYLIFVGCCLLYKTAFVPFFSFIPLYFKEELGIDEAGIGLLSTMNGLLIVVVEMALVYTLERRFQRRLGISAVGVLVTGLSFLALALTQWAGVALITILLMTVGEMLAMPFMQTFTANRANDRNRGQYIGLYTMSWALAQVCSPLMCSQVVERVGFTPLWWLLASLAVLSAVGLFWVNKVQKLSYKPAQQAAVQ
ncbi:MDR family MFS transporter [Fibrella aquatilis]|uniref:MFS transporter n=1 Tax=Fibrella aquatilis TaxID=2817059 RepID=A0A939FZV3_9BACT|nr:MFS transporter [Fibrella aquatilis]MBO0929772.1 MFS transporter [Fibrella aquatilis]